MTTCRPPQIRSAIGDDRTRPRHKAWDGIIRPVDDAFWRTHYPPNGWRCRCSIRGLSARDIARDGLTQTPDADLPADRAGIDTGWDYNIGTAAWGNSVSEQTMQRWQQSRDKWEVLTPGTWKSAGRPKTPPVRDARAAPGPATPDRAALGAAVETAIGGAEATFTMPDGLALHVVAQTLAVHLADSGLDRGRFVPLLREVIEQPTEIWQSFERHRATGKIVLRRRLIAAVRADKDRRLLLVLNALKGHLEAWTFFVSNRDLNQERHGALIFGEDDPTDR